MDVADPVAPAPAHWSVRLVPCNLCGSEDFREVYPSLPKQARLASLDILAKLRRLESLEFLRGVLKSDDADERARAA